MDSIQLPARRSPTTPSSYRHSLPRYCYAYLSWDIAEQAPGSGPIETEGFRSWFEDWLQNAQGNCDHALITFKYISEVTTQDAGTYPSVSDYQAAMTAFLNTKCSYTGTFDFTPWNEPQNGTAGGDGLTVPIPVETDADYYLAMREQCTPPGCTVAAGDFASNGTLSTSFVQNCASDLTFCNGGSYMDQYKYWILTDAPNYGFTSAFRPEVFAYHGWDDINNYIDSGIDSHCTDPQKCTIRALVTALTDGAWTNATIWDTEVAAGQDPESNPTPVVQACAASFLLDLTDSFDHATRVDELVFLIDLTPTLLDASGVVVPKAMQGKPLRLSPSARRRAKPGIRPRIYKAANPFAAERSARRTGCIAPTIQLASTAMQSSARSTWISLCTLSVAIRFSS